MDRIQFFIEEWRWLFVVILLVTIWETIWKMVAMWKAARNNHLAWFICIAVINTIGILPIVYILIYKEEPAQKDHPGLQPPQL